MCFHGISNENMMILINITGTGDSKLHTSDVPVSRDSELRKQDDIIPRQESLVPVGKSFQSC